MTESNAAPVLLPLGPLMIDVAAMQLDDADRQRLSHPLVGGVILFARNFENPGQVSDLIDEIKQLRSPALLVAVDQEGGRVQRFQNGFTRLPAAAEFGKLWQQDKHTGPMRAFESARLMASELIAVGVDFSFAPVFDLTSAPSEVIGDRCFHPQADAAIELLGAYIDGMHVAGMVAIAKHFPGHGGVSADSHHCLPCDTRDLAQLQNLDLRPYRELRDEIQGVMSAHIVYEQCAPEIATYSRYWLGEVLREELGFAGVVFSDDLAMQAAVDAGLAGDDSADAPQNAIVNSAQQALAAGCDMLLVCNRADLVDELLVNLDYTPDVRLSGRLAQLAARTEG